MKLSVIIAIASNKVIGKGDALPWHLSNDLKRFKSITMGHPIIMGRKTYDSIGKLLPGRTNIIITTNKTFQVEGAQVVHSLAEAIDIAKSIDQEEAFVIGGASIIEQGLHLCEQIYLTKVLGNPDGDVFLDLNINENWKMIEEEKTMMDDKNEYPTIFQKIVRQ
jgi:dihydrofolate reductase